MSTPSCNNTPDRPFPNQHYSALRLQCGTSPRQSNRRCGGERREEEEEEKEECGRGREKAGLTLIICWVAGHATGVWLAPSPKLYLPWLVGSFHDAVGWPLCNGFSRTCSATQISPPKLPPAVVRPENEPTFTVTMNMRLDTIEF